MGCGVMQQLVSNLVGGWVTLAAYGGVFEHRLFDLLTTWLPWVAALFGVEFAYYWWHRLSHEVNPLWAQVERYVELVRLARRAPAAFDAVKVFFASPSWRPGWMGAAEERDPAVKYDVSASRPLERYVLGQWLVLLGLTFVFLRWGVATPLPWKLAFAAWIAVSATSIPGLLEGRNWAKPLEALRWVGGAAVTIAFLVTRFP